MGPETSTALPAAGAADRCPQCAASVRPDAPWCTLCWTDLRPAPEPEPEPVALAVPEPVAAGAPPPVPAGKGWPCGTCGFVNAIQADVCAACGAGFLAALRKDEAPLLELPVVGDLTRLSRAQRLGLAAGLVLLVVLLVLLLGVLGS